MIKTEKIVRHLNSRSLTQQSLAVGNDLVHLPTFDKSLTPLFVQRGYTAAEIAYCEQFSDSRLRYASTWAAKEAIYKAIKQVDSDARLWWRDIEILREKPQGKPTVKLRGYTEAPEFALTISHDGDYVWALAVCLYESNVGNV
jgi:phosphopantetheine--protein transferase-like protein